MTNRFNKENVLNKLYEEVSRLEEQWGFDSDNGYDQVKKSEFHRIMAYGFYEAYKSMIDTVQYNQL